MQQTQLRGQCRNRHEIARTYKGYQLRRCGGWQLKSSACIIGLRLRLAFAALRNVFLATLPNSISKKTVIIWHWQFLLVIAAAICPSTAHCIRVQLRSRTHLSLESAQRDGGLALRGLLTDSQGRPVAAAAIALHLVVPKQGALPGEAQIASDLVGYTDTTGRFETVFAVKHADSEQTLVHVEAHFAGTAMYGAADSEQLFDLAKADATLELKLPAAQMTTETAELDVEVLANSGDLAVVDTPIELQVDDRAVLVVRTAADGRAHAILTLAQLGDAGVHRVRASIGQDTPYNPAQAEQRLEVTVAVRIEITAKHGDADQPCGERDWCVDGTVQALHGKLPAPIADATVTLHADKHLLGTLVANKQGRFAAVLRAEQLGKLFAPGAISLVARAQVPLPFHEIGWSPLIALEIEPPAGLSAWWYSVPIALLSLGAVLQRLLARRREKSLLAQQEATQAGLPAEVIRRAGAGGEPSCAVRGRVLHGEHGRGASGEVSISRAISDNSAEVASAVARAELLDGRFAFADLSPGKYRLRAACQEHELLEIEFELPHDGLFDGCELLPASCRAVVRGSFAWSVRRWTGKAVDWGRETPREIEPRVAQALRRGHGEARDAVRHVEKALYGARTDVDEAAAAKLALARVDEVQK